MTPHFVVRTCAGREHYQRYMSAALPQAEICFDDTGLGAMGCFLKACRMHPRLGVVHLEDDVILTRDFVRKCSEAVAARPFTPIQFFSMRKKDLTVGSRMEPGRTFMMNQCHYFPPGMGTALVAFYENEWDPGEKHRNPHGYDILIAAYLHSRRLSYWLHVPSLVDHRVGKSFINPKRASTNRQSLTFRDPMETPHG